MPLRFKFVLPINLILVLVLGTSLAWEWRRSEATELAVLRARLDEEARFIQAAYRSLGDSPRFADYLGAFRHATDATASPEHQVAVVDAAGRLVARAAVHARRPMDPLALAAPGEGTWPRRQGGGSYLVRVADDDRLRVVVAESTRALRGRMWARLREMAVWYLGLGVVLLVAVNLSPGGLPRELGPTGPLLGVMPDVPFGSESVELKPGGLLLAYTDGLDETMGPNGDLWETGEMLEILRTSEADAPSQVVARLLDRAAAFRGPGPPQDDVTIMIARHAPHWADDNGPVTDPRAT